MQPLRLAPAQTIRSGVSAVIPVYNSRLGLPALLERLLPVLTSLNREYEVVLVNDGSPDESWDLICQLARLHPAVRGINLMRNYGQHNALLCGIRAAAYDVTVTLDDDLQNPPEEIPKLLARLSEGCDVVYGVGRQEQHGLWRDLASQVTKLTLQGAMGAETARHVSAFRAFRTQVREAFYTYRGPFPSIDVLLTWGAARFGTVPVQHDPRRLGASNYTFRKLVTHALNMMTGFSTLPLEIASLAGLASTEFGLVILVYVLGHFIVFGGSVPGFSFLASTINLCVNIATPSRKT